MIIYKLKYHIFRIYNIVKSQFNEVKNYYFNILKLITSLFVVVVADHYIQSLLLDYGYDLNLASDYSITYFSVLASISGLAISIFLPLFKNSIQEVFRDISKENSQALFEIAFGNFVKTSAFVLISSIFAIFALIMGHDFNFFFYFISLIPTLYLILQMVKIGTKYYHSLISGLLIKKVIDAIFTRLKLLKKYNTPDGVYLQFQKKVQEDLVLLRIMSKSDLLEPSLNPVIKYISYHLSTYMRSNLKPKNKYWGVHETKYKPLSHQISPFSSIEEFRFKPHMSQDEEIDMNWLEQDLFESLYSLIYKSPAGSGKYILKSPKDFHHALQIAMMNGIDEVKYFNTSYALESLKSINFQSISLNDALGSGNNLILKAYSILGINIEISNVLVGSLLSLENFYKKDFVKQILVAIHSHEKTWFDYMSDSLIRHIMKVIKNSIAMTDIDIRNHFVEQELQHYIIEYLVKFTQSIIDYIELNYSKILTIIDKHNTDIYFVIQFQASNIEMLKKVSDFIRINQDHWKQLFADIFKSIYPQSNATIQDYQSTISNLYAQIEKILMIRHWELSDTLTKTNSFTLPSYLPDYYRYSVKLISDYIFQTLQNKEVPDQVIWKYYQFCQKNNYYKINAENLSYNFDTEVYRGLYPVIDLLELLSYMWLFTYIYDDQDMQSKMSSVITQMITDWNNDPKFIKSVKLLYDDKKHDILGQHRHLDRSQSFTTILKKQGYSYDELLYRSTEHIYDNKKQKHIMLSKLIASNRDFNGNFKINPCLIFIHLYIYPVILK